MKKCGSPCKTGKPCKKTSPCSVHEASSLKKSPKRSASPTTPPENKLKDPLFRRLENLPVEVVWQTLLNVPLDQINAVCVAYPKGKIAAVCSDEKFKREYKERTGMSYRSLAEKAAYLYVKSGVSGDESFENWIESYEPTYLCPVIIDNIYTNDVSFAFMLLLSFADTSCVEQHLQPLFDTCMETLLKLKILQKYNKSLQKFYNNYKALLLMEELDGFDMIDRKRIMKQNVEKIFDE